MGLSSRIITAAEIDDRHRRLVDRILKEEPGVASAGDDWQLVTALRSWAYRNIRRQTDYPALLDQRSEFAFYTKDAADIFEAFAEDLGGVVGGGCGFALLRLYEAFGFESLMIDCGSAGSYTRISTLCNLGQGDNSLWAVQDPNYDFALATPAGGPIDIREVVQLLRRGRRDAVLRLDGDPDACREIIMLPEQLSMLDHEWTIDPTSAPLRVLPDGRAVYRSHMTMQRYADGAEGSKTFLREKGFPEDLLYFYVLPIGVYPANLPNAIELFDEIKALQSYMADIARIPLSRIAAIGNGKVIHQGDAVVLITVPQQWGYSAEAGFDLRGIESRERVVNVRLEVASGELALGWLSSDALEWVARTSIACTTGAVDVTLLIPEGTIGGRLIFDNATEGERSAVAIITGISVTGVEALPVEPVSKAHPVKARLADLGLTPRAGESYEAAELDVDAYRRYGIFVIRGFFSTDEHEPLCAVWQEFYDRSLRERREVGGGGASPQDLCEQPPPEIGQLYRHPKLIELMRTLYGNDIVFCQQRILIKDHHYRGGVPPHQDFSYYFGGIEKTNIFIPLTVCGPQNGGLHFILGSHKFGYLGDQGFIPHDKLVEGSIPGFRSVCPTLQPGDVALMDICLLHLSNEATCPDPRVYVNPCYQPATDGSFDTLISGDWKTDFWWRDYEIMRYFKTNTQVFAEELNNLQNK